MLRVPRRLVYFGVTVEDINDNAPIFNSGSYSEKISSNAQVNRVAITLQQPHFIKAKVMGSNPGHYSRIPPRIMITAMPLMCLEFTLKLGSSFLSPAYQQRRTEYKFVVQAKDSGKPQSLVMFDPDPISPSYAYRIAEVVTQYTRGCDNHPELQLKHGQSSCSVFLVDARARCSPSRPVLLPSQNFSKGHNMVNVSVAQQLDYEKVKQYSVILRCQNFGGLTMYDQITLTIDVEDRNNKVPYFAGMDANGRYAGTVPENTKAGATVIEVQGYDDDVRGLQQASVVVQVDITDKNDNPMTFKQPLYNHTVQKLHPLAPLYSQLQPMTLMKVYSLILESRDSENFYSATTSVIIYISDENDPPVFEK
ncbi:hypothetical protein Btru_074031 [Bulinus truncatus]|nr:hypothetical protein Btru_074031 [Bulinus truncatus]